jgi:hypothetical protein
MFFKLCGGPGQILAAYQGEIGLEENAKVRGSLRFYFCWLMVIYVSITQDRSEIKQKSLPPPQYLFQVGVCLLNPEDVNT